MTCGTMSIYTISMEFTPGLASPWSLALPVWVKPPLSALNFELVVLSCHLREATACSLKNPWCF
jgi:hypothetical protein